MEDEKIYRIMSMYEFYELYVNNRLKLSQIFIQNDKNDGIESIFNQVLFAYYNWTRDIEKTFERTRKSRYITCWSKSKDSMAIWLLYSKNNESIRVMTTKRKLENVLNKYSENISMYTQWERPNDNIVSIEGMQRVRDVMYKDIRAELSTLNDEFISLKKQIEIINKEDQEKYINEFTKTFQSFYDKLNKKYKFDEFIKDSSFSFENEVRGEIHLAIKNDKYTSKEDWIRKTEESLAAPISDDLNGILPPVTYASVPNDFIEEICFDPRMENYKKTVLMSLLKIDSSLIAESKIFSPIITLNTKLDPIKGILDNL
ncbi:TPA: hypothetical protein PXE99_000403 [Mannheimia haemolytica]|nr:hypothetical protein [Mannheimia haemolytica]